MTETAKQDTAERRGDIRRVAVFGGTGFVGGYLVDALIANSLQPVLLVRDRSQAKVRQPERCVLVGGDIDDADAVRQVVEASDAVIYNIGILREFPKRGISFDQLQRQGACRAMDAALAAGVRRFLLMSANGVRADGTAYQQSKYGAEAYLESVDLDGTVFRPSVLFGDPRGQMEFATRLCAEIIDSPLPAPLFHSGLLPLNAGQFTLSPVHVSDVSSVFVKALQDPRTIGRTLHLGGPETLTWKQILSRLAKTRGRRKMMLPAPALGVMAAASLLDRFEDFPITRDQLRMLLEGNACEPADLLELGIDPRPFSGEALAYLNATTADAAAASGETTG